MQKRSEKARKIEDERPEEKGKKEERRQMKEERKRRVLSCCLSSFSFSSLCVFGCV